MSHSFLLMPGRREQIPAYLEIFRGTSIGERYFSDGGRLRDVLTQALDRGELWHAATSEGTLTGVMRVVPRGFCGLYHYLALIGTAPAVRGTGAGRFLMDSFESMAKADGCRRTSLMVSDFNHSARNFYRTLGYWELGQIPNAAKQGIVEYVLLKDLYTEGA